MKPMQSYRDAQARYLRKVRRLCSCSWCESRATGGLVSNDHWHSAIVLLGCIGIALGLLVFRGCTPAQAEVSDQDAIKILVGEASNQGYIGMIAVAEVLRLQNSTRGFYGLKAKHSSHEPLWVWKQAQKAWNASKTSNFTKGANHFENINAFGKPYWVSRCVEVFRYKDHVFYREKGGANG